MATLFRNGALVASLAVLTAAGLAFAGPLARSANAGTPCGLYGDAQPLKLSNLQARAAIRCLLNRKRHDHGLASVQGNGHLEEAAQRHTRYMIRRRCFSHQCPGERSVLARLVRADYIVAGLRRWSYGENIAWGARWRGTPKAIVKAWMHSPEHRANILNPRFDEIGIGFSSGYPRSANADGATYTTDFGMRHR